MKILFGLLLFIGLVFFVGFPEQHERKYNYEPGPTFNNPHYLGSDIWYYKTKTGIECYSVGMPTKFGKYKPSCNFF